MTQPRFYPLGDAALVCEVPPPATLDCQRRVWAVAEAARAWPDVIDVVPGMNNLTIVFDALATTAESLTPALRDAGDGRRRARGRPRGRDPGRIRRRRRPRSAGRRRAYRPVGRRSRRAPRGRRLRRVLRRLPAGLRVSRRADAALQRRAARLEVPAGSVGIGGAQTGIYPATSPGGWQLIGRTSHVLFDPARPQPTLLLPGDRVRFTIAGVDAR